MADEINETPLRSSVLTDDDYNQSTIFEQTHPSGQRIGISLYTVEKGLILVEPDFIGDNERSGISYCPATPLLL